MTCMGDYEIKSHIYKNIIEKEKNVYVLIIG